jgi:hypothetical protein
LPYRVSLLPTTTASLSCLSSACCQTQSMTPIIKQYNNNANLRIEKLFFISIFPSFASSFHIRSA